MLLDSIIIHFKNFLYEIASNTIGINLWLAPQISEHCPKYNPGRIDIVGVWFKRPGIASTFTPNEGTVHEWITSFEVIITRTEVIVGKIIRLSTSNRRNLFFFKSLII